MVKLNKLATRFKEYGEGLTLRVSCSRFILILVIVIFILMFPKIVNAGWVSMTPVVVYDGSTTMFNIIGNNISSVWNYSVYIELIERPNEGHIGVSMYSGGPFNCEWGSLNYHYAGSSIQIWSFALKVQEFNTSNWPNNQYSVIAYIKSNLGGQIVAQFPIVISMRPIEETGLLQSIRIGINQMIRETLEHLQNMIILISEILIQIRNLAYSGAMMIEDYYWLVYDLLYIVLDTLYEFLDVANDIFIGIFNIADNIGLILFNVVNLLLKLGGFGVALLYAFFNPELINNEYLNTIKTFILSISLAGVSLQSVIISGLIIGIINETIILISKIKQLYSDNTQPEQLKFKW